MNVLSRLSVSCIATVTVAAGLGSCAEATSAAPENGDAAASSDARVATDPGVRGAAQPLGLSGANEPGGVCATVADAPCGGDVAGSWQLADFCTPEPAGNDRPCEGPGENEAECAGEASSRICNLLYGGTADFTSSELAASFSVAARVRYTFTDPCLAAIGGGAQGGAACDGVATPRLACQYADGSCACEATLDPQSETRTLAYTVDGETITLVDGDKTATGAYCVQGEWLTIVFDPHGPQGWRAWVLKRTP